MIGPSGCQRRWMEDKPFPWRFSNYHTTQNFWIGCCPLPRPSNRTAGTASSSRGNFHQCPVFHSWPGIPNRQGISTLPLCATWSFLLLWPGPWLLFWQQRLQQKILSAAEGDYGPRYYRDRERNRYYDPFDGRRYRQERYTPRYREDRYRRDTYKEHRIPNEGRTIQERRLPR